MASQFGSVHVSDDAATARGQVTFSTASNSNGPGGGASNGVGGPGARPSDGRWVENSFTKRDCVRYVASTKDVARCACGQNWAYHRSHGVDSVGEAGEVWSPAQHTASSPTDAYGTIDFLGGPHPNKAQFIRLGFESRPDLILQLLTREWGLELPKLIISVHGGKANFELQSRLKRILRKGLLRAAKTTGAWILTGGTNTGVTKHVGDALISERSPRLRGGRVVSIGIAPWGVVENRATLVGRRKDVTYLSIDQPRSKFAVLNNRHAYFLLADNGTVGRYGAEIALRRKLEKYISSQRLPARTYCSIPVVCLIVEGGMHTIRTVLEYVTDSPPVPVVVVEGSGRAADLIAFAHKYASSSDEDSSVLDGMHEQLTAAIERTFSVDTGQAERLLSELLQCVKKKDLITIYRPSDGASADITDDSQELDHAILSALFRSRHLSAAEQLSLALAWNRVDIARSEIFVYGQEWSDGALEEAMMEALVNNRVDFVKLLLENGVQMNKFLTITRLEELYNSRQGPANTLRYIVRDVRPHMPRNYQYTLIDIGLVINKLMGGAYRSSYTRRKFRHIYTVLTKRPNVTSAFSQSALARVYSNHLLRNGATTNNQSLTDETHSSQEVSASSIFTQPFNELLLWSVLTKRQAMAKLMWHHGEEALAKALVASTLFRAMASEAADDDLEVEIYDELRSYAGEFDREALELLDYCYRQDDDLAQQLLTCELPNWSRQTCLCLAFACHHRELLAHPCAQLILGDLWLGGLRTRRSTNFKVVAAILCPPLILRLEFKSKQELQLMPQTEEEHMIDLKDERDDNDRSTNSSSSSSSSSSSASSSPSHSPNLSMRRVSVAGDESINRPRLTSVSGGDALILCPPEKDDLDEVEANTSKDHIINDPTDGGVYERKRTKQLRIKKKVYEFYAAPITKFWSWSMAYFLFLVVFTYTVLIRTPAIPEWNECYVIAYIVSFGGEKVREILASEPVKLSHKFRVWSSGVWNCCDAFFVLEFLIAMVFRFREESMDVGHVLYCLNIVYWYIRILRILQVSKFLGPFVTMIGRMLEKMIYYITLMLVVLMSYGVFRQAVLFPHEEFSWSLVRDIFFKPYFMIYGELFAETIDPPCGNGTRPDGTFDPDMPPCETGRWLNPLLMTCYLLVANILLLNLLIAVFNSIFLRTNVYSHQIWKFNRFSVVMEYEQKPALPPPLIVFSHFYFIAKWCRRRANGIKESYDYGLKLFLDKDDLERLYDFEEESMEGLVREREAKLHLSTDERVRIIVERLDGMASKIEDGHQRASQQNESLQSLDYRLMRLEEVAEQTSASLAVIHRFMVFQGSGSQLDLAGKEHEHRPAMRRSQSSKSSPNVAASSLTAEDFKKHLIADDNVVQGRRSSCAAFNPDDDEEEDKAPLAIASAVQLVDPQDLAKLKSLGQGMKLRQRTASETSQDGAHILHAMQEEAGRELDQVTAGAGVRRMSVGTRRPSLLQSTVPLAGERNSQEDDDLITTRAMASRDPSEPGSPDCALTNADEEDEEITEVFDNCEEADDVMPGHAAVASSPMHRSCSVTGRPELRKRFRNWSGTHTGSTDALEFSPRSSRRLANPQQRHKSPEDDVKNKATVCADCSTREGTSSATAATEHRRARLQPMLSCPSQTKWTLSCNACQLVRSSHSCGSFASQSNLPALPVAEPVPKITIVPPASLPRNRSSNNGNNRPTGGAGHQPAAAAAAKVEAEAEHLREIEGQDYQMMEGIIRRRLHRDSEDLDNSLEDLCNAPIPLDEAMDSFDEAHEIHQEAVSFLVGETLIDLESENARPKYPVVSSSAPVASQSPPAVQRPVAKASSEPPGQVVTKALRFKTPSKSDLAMSTMAAAAAAAARVSEDVTIEMEAEEQC